MRFFALSAAALSLATSALADSSSWSTATSTRTVYMVNTVTRTGTPPAETQNTTATTMLRPSYGAPVPSANGTVGVTPTTKGAQPTFTGAAGRNIASVAVLIGGAVVALAL